MFIFLFLLSGLHHGYLHIPLLNFFEYDSGYRTLNTIFSLSTLVWRLKSRMKFCDLAFLTLHKHCSNSINSGQSFNHSANVHQAALPDSEGLSSRSCTLPSRACRHACGNLKTLEPLLALYIYTLWGDWTQIIRLHSKRLSFEPTLRFPVWALDATSGGRDI